MRAGGGGSRTTGQNVAAGIPIRFLLKEDLPKDTVARIVIKGEEDLVTFSTKPDKKKNEIAMKAAKGMNEVTWNMRVAGAKSFDGMVLWGGGLQGPQVVPGKYKAELSIGDDKQEIEFELAKDPRNSATDADFQAQYDFLVGVRDKLTEVHMSIKKLRDAKAQIGSLSKRLGDAEEYKEIVESGKSLSKRLTEIEKRLYQTQNQSPQDPLNFPIRLNNRLSSLVGVVSTGDYPPTQQSIEVRDTLIAEMDKHLAELSSILKDDIKKFNSMVSKAKVPAIMIEQDSDEKKKSADKDGDK